MGSAAGGWIYLEFVAEGVAFDNGRDALVVEDAHLALVLDVNQLLGTRGRVCDI